MSVDTIKAEILKRVDVEKLKGVGSLFLERYLRETRGTLKAIDMFLLYVLATGVLQFVYMALLGSFPYNAFLSGFASAVGVFVLGVSLRLQVESPEEFHHISQQRAFADFVLCNILLHFVVMTFMG